ncbi:hypothetical protein QVD17_40516 [Tagetes erecta]|uniref:Uncharacterized protein n=1 Tax=Tagetes erecta TaxID=13708 RepID=A0AAD8NAU8_TARER|nr:hypothetical protein QVD17_40516 [Tagetes erecta]
MVAQSILANLGNQGKAINNAKKQGRHEASSQERVTCQRHRKDGGRENKEGEALTAKLDNNERLADFVQKLESACVETGKMTDQGSCHSNPRTQGIKGILPEQ